MRVSRMSMLVAAFALLGPAVCNAMFMQPQLETVPVARLVKNVEMKLKAKPKDPKLLFTLARIHSMAYARKATKLEVQKGKDGPWFGFVPKGVPYRVNKSDNKDDIALAKSHLTKAIELHKKVIALKSDHYVAKLGLAWCTEQSGKKKEAIKLYRALIKESLPKDRKLDGRYDGLPTISTEASTYLIKLLDAKKDAVEIAKLKKQSEETEKRIPRMITPVAVSLRRDLHPEQFIDADAKVRFDLDGSGIQRKWQWIAKDTAWLVYDHSGEGKITSALQMFGNVTFWLFWENGYAAMSALDDNNDNKLRGAELRNLALWHDRNQNGISEKGEVKSLAEHGIIEIDCASRTSNSGMPHNPKGVTFKDGHTRPTCDVVLKSQD